MVATEERSMRSAVVVLTVIAFGGLLFLGSGITGLVISETCCTGSLCSAENLCDELQEPTVVNPAHTAVLVGGLLLFLALALYISLQVSASH